MDNELTFNDYVRLSIESGVKPLELCFFPITDFESNVPFAFRTETTIHSVLLGDMEESSYTYVSDIRECGAELFKHNVEHAINAVKKIISSGKSLEYLSVRCPSELVEKNDMYDIVSKILLNHPDFEPSKLCLEFPSELFIKDNEKAKVAVLDMKLLKVKTAINGCGKEDFYLSKLAEITPDFAILDPTATAFSESRNKPQLLNSLVAYIRSMGAEVIASGKLEYKKSMRGTDCVGFIDTESRPYSIEEAIELIVEE